MAEVPVVTFTDAELSEDAHLPEESRFVTQVFYFKDGMGQKIKDEANQNDPAVNFTPEAGAEGYINTIPRDSNGENLMAYADATAATKAYVTEQRWKKLGGENTLAIDKSGSMFLKPQLASTRGYIDNIYGYEEAPYPNALVKWTKVGTAPKIITVPAKEGASVKVKNNTTNTAIGLKVATFQNLFPAYPDTTAGTSTAFVLLLNVVPNDSSPTTKNQEEQNRWQITTTLGDLKITIREDDRVKVDIDGHVTEVSNPLNEFLETGRLASRWKTGKTYRFFVYRTFNGVMISNGISLDSELNETGKKGETRPTEVSTFCRKNPDFDWSAVWDEYSQLATSISGEYGALKIPCAPAGSPAHPELGDGSDEYVDLTGDLLVEFEKCHGNVNVTPVVYYGRGEHKTFLMKIEETAGETDEEYIGRILVLPIWSNLGSKLGIHVTKWIKENASGEKWLRLTFIVSDRNDGSAAPFVDTGVTQGSEPDPIALNDERRDVYSSSPVLLGFAIRKARTEYDPFGYETGLFNIEGEGLDERVTSVEVTCGLDGTSGSISIDGGGLDVPTNKIGGLEIEVEGGYNTVGGTLAKVIAWGYGVDRSFGEDTFSVELTGRETVLNDIKPGMYDYYDGRNNFDTVQEMLALCGFSFNHQQDGHELAIEDELPSSSDPLQAPMIDFQGGTPVMEALQRIAELDLHRILIDLDGKAWYIAVSDETEGGAIEYWTRPKTWVYPDADVISVSDSPNFDDLRNHIMLVGMGLQFDKNKKVNDFLGVGDFFVVRKEIKVVTDPVIAWDRGMFQVIPGFKDKPDLEDDIKVWKHWSQIVYHESQSTIPGNSDVRLLDRFETSLGTFVIVNISHSVNLEGKEWTTSLGLQRGGDFHEF